MILVCCHLSLLWNSVTPIGKHNAITSNSAVDIVTRERGRTDRILRNGLQQHLKYICSLYTGNFFVFQKIVRQKISS